MRKSKLETGTFYHLFNRGVDKRAVFVSQDDHDRFQAYLFLLNDEKNIRPANFFVGERAKKIFDAHRRGNLVAIAAYSLLPNHFHILATPLVDGGLSKFMQRVQTAYTMYFNEKHHRTGSLFEGAFKAAHVADENHLKYVLGYIHMSPAKLFDAKWEGATVGQLSTLAHKAAQYKYSSVGEYLSGKPSITAPMHLPKNLARAAEMSKHLDFWLKRKDDFRNPAFE